MAQVQISDTLAASAKSVWELIRDFGGIEKWSGGGIESCTVAGEGVGAVRTLKLPGGAGLQERLESYDEAGRTFQYAIIGESPLPVTDYLSTLRVVEEGAASCRVEWGSTFEPAGAPEEQVRSIVEGIYRGGIGGIKKTLGV